MYVYIYIFIMYIEILCIDKYYVYIYYVYIYSMIYSVCVFDVYNTLKVAGVKFPFITVEGRNWWVRSGPFLNRDKQGPPFSIAKLVQITSVQLQGLWMFMVGLHHLWMFMVVCGV